MIFTINALDNGYFFNGHPSGELENICFNSWTKYFDVKVFDFNSPEIKECKEKYKDYLSLCLQKNSLSCYSDVLRMYILSLYPNSVYFDTDMYLANPENLSLTNNNWQTAGGFYLIYNGKETHIAKDILKFYRVPLKVLNDKEIISLARLNYRCFYFEKPIGVHLPFFSEESPHFCCICNDTAKIPELYQKFENRPDKKEKSRLYFLTDIFDKYKDNQFTIENNQVLNNRKNLSRLLKDDRVKILEIARKNKHFIGEAF